MKFRFQVIASAFHKGRLKIVYDPAFFSSNEYNTNYTYIIDLAKERDFTVQIGWGSERAWLYRRNAMTSSLRWGTSPVTNPFGYGNGVIAVYVVNDLAVPNTTVDNDVQINVFVSAGDDFEVANPDPSVIEDISWFYQDEYVAQMGEENPHPDSDLTTDENAPLKTQATEIMAPIMSMRDKTDLVYYGDPVVSFRQCLKRFMYHSSTVPNIATLCNTVVKTPDFPFYRGQAPGAVHLSTVPSPNSPYNYAHNTLLNYLTPAFVCRRGGMRWKYARTGSIETGSELMIVSRDPVVSTGYLHADHPQDVVGSSTISERVRKMCMEVPHLWGGSTVTTTTQNPVLEVELPYYSPYRFSPAKLANQTSLSEFNLFHDLLCYWQPGVDTNPAIHAFTSVGEDFSLFFFTGAPRAFFIAKDDEPPAQGV
jgi:hypothetical protein